MDSLLPVSYCYSNQKAIKVNTAPATPHAKLTQSFVSHFQPRRGYHFDKGK